MCWQKTDAAGLPCAIITRISDAIILEGGISVRAALAGGMRPVREVVLDRARRDYETQQLARAAKQAGVKVRFEDRAAIDALAQGTTHGGVVALAGERIYQPLDELVTGAGAAFIAMLDGVEDPFNFGQAVRAMYAAGARGLVLRARNWTSAAGVVARSSAGASERIPIALVNEAEEAVAFFKQHGLKIAVTAKAKDAIPIYQADLAQPLFLLVGGEKRGIQNAVMDAADLHLEIPDGRPFNASLGAAMAAAVIAFEVMRQRQAAKMSAGA